jgi:hypothetical protein
MRNSVTWLEPPSGGILVALAAGLCVLPRAQPLGEGLDFLEFRLLGGGVNQAIAFGVEARGGGRKAPAQTREALMTRKQKYR